MTQVEIHQLCTLLECKEGADDVHECPVPFQHIRQQVT